MIPLGEEAFEVPVFYFVDSHASCEFAHHSWWCQRGKYNGLENRSEWERNNFPGSVSDEIE